GAELGHRDEGAPGFVVVEGEGEGQTLVEVALTLRGERRDGAAVRADAVEELRPGLGRGGGGGSCSGSLRGLARGQARGEHGEGEDESGVAATHEGFLPRGAERRPFS